MEQPIKILIVEDNVIIADDMQSESDKTFHEEPEEKDVLTKLKELGELKEKGVISEEEFATMKKKLIEDF